MWQKGKYIDLWTLVHFLFGVLFVFAANFFELTLLPALIILIALTTVWEVLEFVSRNAVEPFSNRVTDVIVAVIGFALMYTLLLVNTLEKEIYVIIFSVIAFVFVVLNINGWNNHMKK